MKEDYLGADLTIMCNNKDLIIKIEIDNGDEVTIAFTPDQARAIIGNIQDALYKIAALKDDNDEA